MKEKEETILLRKIIENEDPNPAPNRIEFVSPHYEIIVPIGEDHTASVFIDAESYFELLESEEFTVD